MKEFTADTDYKVLGASECIDTETVKGSEWHVRMINLRFSLEMLNEWFDTDVINDALCYTTQVEGDHGRGVLEIPRREKQAQV